MRRALLACFVLLAVLLAAAPLPASAAVCVASPDTVTLLPDQDWYFDVSPGGGCVMRLTVTTSNISGVRFDSYGLTIGAPLYGDNNIIDYNVTVLGTSVWIRNRSTQTLDMSIYSLTITRTPSPSPVASYTARPVATLTSPPYITGIAPSPSPLPSATPQFTPTPAPTQIPQGGLCSGSRTGQTCFGGNFADSQYGWSILSSGMGTYVPGIGFVGTQYSGYDLKGIVYYFPVPITIEQFVLQIWDSNAPNCGESSSASVRVNGAWVGLSPAYSTGFNQNGTYIWGTSNNVGYSNVDGIQIAYGRCQSVPGEFLQFAIWYDGVPYSTPTPGASNTAAPTVSVTSYSIGFIGTPDYRPLCTETPQFTPFPITATRISMLGRSTPVVSPVAGFTPVASPTLEDWMSGGSTAVPVASPTAWGASGGCRSRGVAAVNSINVNMDYLRDCSQPALPDGSCPIVRNCLTVLPGVNITIPKLQIGSLTLFEGFGVQWEEIQVCLQYRQFALVLLGVDYAPLGILGLSLGLVAFALAVLRDTM